MKPTRGDPPRGPRLRLAAFVALAQFAAASCATGGGASGTGHFDGRTWSGAWRGFTGRKSEWIPVAALLVATPILEENEHHLAEDTLNEDVFHSSTDFGDWFAIGLGVLPLTWGAIDAAGGDSRYLEVGAESLAATMATTYLFKVVVNKQRPDQSAEDSFPSAHTAFAFAGATLLARRIEDEYDSWLGYLAYLPATYVGITRIEGERHYVSDVTVGAALALLLTNLVYDAHYGGADSPGIFGTGGNVRFSFGPGLEGAGASFGLTWSF